MGSARLTGSPVWDGAVPAFVDVDDDGDMDLGLGEDG